MSKRTPPKSQAAQPAPSTPKSRQGETSPPPAAGAKAPKKAAGTVSAARPNGIAGGTGPSHEQIAAYAYEIWVSRGRPVGTSQEDWFEAERRLCAEPH
jgi:hypothetical protein